jgi:putative molybdopterin biosynthesis protein
VAGPLLTTLEVAALLRVHPKQVYRLLKRGLPSRRVGSEWRFEREAVLAWSSGATPGAPAAPGPGLAAPPGGPDAPPLPALVAANGDVAVVALLKLVAERGPPLLGFVQADARSGADLLGRGAVLAAGAHAGGFPSHLGGERVARLHLVTREIGLVGARGAAAAPRPSDLPRLRLASRPAGAGVRAHLDAALARVGLDAAALHRGALLCHSHLDVVTAVAAGRADAGLCSRAWGERLGLPFFELAREPYGLLVRARDLGDPRVVRLCEVAQSPRYRSAVEAIPGYDAAGAGDVRYDGA